MGRRKARSSSTGYGADLLEKKCDQCGHTKSTSEYYKSQWSPRKADGSRSRTGDGYRNICKPCINANRRMKDHGAGSIPRKVGREPTIHEGLRRCSRCSDRYDTTTWKPVDRFYPPTIEKGGTKVYRYYCIDCETSDKRAKGVKPRVLRPQSHATDTKECESCDKSKALKHFRLTPSGGTKDTCFKCERTRIECELCEEKKLLKEFDKSEYNKLTGRQRVCRQCNS